MNVPQNISIYKITKILFTGGILSLIIAVFLFEFSGSTSVIMVGIVEEAAKVLAIIWFLKDRQVKYIFNGLLIGAAVGTGFLPLSQQGMR
nr:PrsW family glutamic-type intramembrane protease [Mesobacillus harenae]